MIDRPPTAPRHELAAGYWRRGAFNVAADAPYTWASGKRMPVYTDTRGVLGDPSLRTTIARGLHALVTDARAESAAWIAGTATAGIPHATSLADRMGLPLGYVRAAAKAHGAGRSVEGLSRDDVRRGGGILVEDLISTGGSVLRAVDALRRYGAQVELIVAIFSYGLPIAARRLAAARPPVRSAVLCSLDDVVAAGRRLGTLTDDAAGVVAEWRRDPMSWWERRATGGQPS